VRASLGEVFYNVTVTPTEMWQAVGLELQRVRLARKLKPIQVERAGGPTYKTVQAIEDGRAGTVKNLEKYAEVLNISIVDVAARGPDRAHDPAHPRGRAPRAEICRDDGRRAHRADRNVERGADTRPGADAGRCGNAFNARSIASCPAGSNASY
jgi:hypothetical protein